MKKIFICLGMTAALSGFFSCTAQNGGFHSLEVKEFAAVLANGRTLLVDVRTAEEYQEGHIAGALNIDVKRDDFDSVARRALPEGRMVALYCRSGVRSKAAAGKLKEAGYDVVDLSGGYNAWTSAGRTDARPLAGGFSDPRLLDANDLNVFRTAAKAYNRPLPEPAHVSTQVVAGLNYRFVCRHDTVVTVFRPLPGQGDPQVTDVKKVTGNSSRP